MGGEVVPATPGIDPDEVLEPCDYASSGPPAECTCGRCVVGEAPDVDLRPYEIWPIERVRPYVNNAREHPADQVADLAKSLDEFGWVRPLFCDRDGTLRVGHGMLEAAKARGRKFVPVIVLEGMTDAQLRGYVIADNAHADRAKWNEDLLRAELVQLKVDNFPLGVLGIPDGQLSLLLKDPRDQERPGEGGEDEGPDAPQAAIVSGLGDLWFLGKHRILCGDSTDPAAIARLMGSESAALLHADPPYGMGKEADGVENDNLYAEKLVRFQLAWWRACRPHLRPNASAYIWGNAEELWRLWYGGLGDSEPLTLRNEIVWDKKSIAGMASPDLTCFPTASERCLFFQLGRHVFLVNQTKDDYWRGWDPVRLWLCAERDKMQWRPRDIREICGNHMHGHWFGESQWVFVSADNYAKLQEAAAGRAFVRDYTDLLAEYRELQARFNGEVRDDRRAEFDAARPWFDNAHDIMRDVWEFPRVTGDDRHGHATPKPVAMMERIMRSSARPGEVVLEPFAGSGSTLMGAEAAGRVCFALELQPVFVDVVCRRWKASTGEDARLGSPEGPTFEQIAVSRGEG